MSTRACGRISCRRLSTRWTFEHGLFFFRRTDVRNGNHTHVSARLYRRYSRSLPQVCPCLPAHPVLPEPPTPPTHTTAWRTFFPQWRGKERAHVVYREPEYQASGRNTQTR